MRSFIIIIRVVGAWSLSLSLMIVFDKLSRDIAREFLVLIIGQHICRDFEIKGLRLFFLHIFNTTNDYADYNDQQQ